MRLGFRRVAVAHKPSSRAQAPWARVPRSSFLKQAKGARATPMQIAVAQVQKIARTDLEAMIVGLQACLASLRSGKGHLDDVSEFGLATLAAEMIERQGVVRGLEGQIAEADGAIMSMRLRADKATGRVGALFGREIIALSELIVIHRFQLEQISTREYERVLRSLAGRLGGKIQSAVARVDAG